MTIILYKYSEIIKTSFCRDSVIFIRFQWTCLNISHLFWTAYLSVGTFFHLSEATDFKRFELSCCVYPVMLCAWFPLHIIAVSLVDLLTTKWNPCTSKVKDRYLALTLSRLLFVPRHSVLSHYCYLLLFQFGLCGEWLSAFLNLFISNAYYLCLVWRR